MLRHIMNSKTSFFSLLAYILLIVAPANAQSQSVVKGSVGNSDFHEAYTPSFARDAVHKPVRNIILMIGDGMGLTHVASGMYANRGELTTTNIKTCGYLKTQSYDNFTTDSAAAGTALASGKKTKNGYVGTDPEGRAIESIAEQLAAKGYATGVVTTDYLDGATPAAFYAHQNSRNMSKEILGDLAKSKLTFFAGASSERIDEKRPELWSELDEAGFTVTRSYAGKPESKIGRLAVIPELKNGDLLKESRGDFLPATTKYALEYLSEKSRKGFFVMVEGACIDKGSHSNDFGVIVQEMLDFDRAVEAAIRFAEKDGHTLVIITADHETGGLCLGNSGNIEKGGLSGTFSSTNHTPVIVPLFAYGPYSDMFRGVQDNTDVAKKIMEIFSKR